MRPAALLLVVAAAAAACRVPGQAPPGPNVVVILCDDLGAGDVGAYGTGSRIPTPNLDRLAAEGTLFTDAHSPSAVCTPTRYGLVTGRYAWRTELRSGVLWGSSPALIEPGRATLASLLQEAGWDTAGFGKWHLGLGDGEATDWSAPLRPGPVTVGFDTYQGIPASLDMAPYVWIVDDGLEEPATATIAGSAHRRQGGGGFWREGPIAPSLRLEDVLPRTVDAAVAWVGERARDPDPFFLYVPLSAPHTPWLPDAAASGTTDVGHYGDFVAMTDREIGRVLAALEGSGRARDTIVVVTSDNGSHWPDADVERWGHDANAGLRGQKADAWEGGHRVPFLVRWPGRVPAGATSDALLCLTDVLPTVAALCGVPVGRDAAEDGFDQSAVWLGRAPAARDHLVMHSLNGLFAYREGPWKLIDGLGSGGFTAPKRTELEPGGPRGQLYHLEADPAEARNLWLERPEIVERLAARLVEVRAADRSVERPESPGNSARPAPPGRVFDRRGSAPAAPARLDD